MAVALTPPSAAPHGPVRQRPEPPAPITGLDHEGITLLLDQRYGDGLIYLHGDRDRVLLHQAIDHGLVNEEGYLTPAGYRFWLGRSSSRD